MHFVTAFLLGGVEENIYMEVPQNVVGVDRITSFCVLVKTLYGLKQGPRELNLKLKHFLKNLQFICNSDGPCPYVT